MKFIKLSIIALLMHASCFGMTVTLPLPLIEVFIETLRQASQQQPLSVVHNQMVGWIQEGIEQNAIQQLVAQRELYCNLVQSVNQEIFMHNFNLIESALASNVIANTINAVALQSHLNILNVRFLETTLDYFTKQFLIEYLKIVFDKYGHYIGILDSNKDKILKLFNNYLRTFSNTDKEHTAFLQKLVNIYGQKSPLKDVLNYNAKYGSRPLSISEEHRSIDIQWNKIKQKITTHQHYQTIDRILYACQTGQQHNYQFDRADKIIAEFKEHCSKKSYNERLIQYLETTVSNARIRAQEAQKAASLATQQSQNVIAEKAEKLIPERHEFKILYAHLENIRKLNPSLQKNFAQAMTRALWDDECALLYNELTRRSYNAVIQHKNSMLFQVKCLFPTTEIQKKFETIFLQNVLKFADKDPKTVDSINIWNSANACPLHDESYLEHIFEGTTEQPMVDFISIGRATAVDQVSNVQKTSYRYYNIPLKAFTDDQRVHDRQVIELAHKALTSTIYHKLPPYDLTDADPIRFEKYQQRYAWAIEEFTFASPHIYHPHAQEKLLSTLMDDITQEYVRIYDAVPKIVFDHALSHMENLPEFAKNYFIELTDILKPSDHLSHMVDWYKTFTSDQKQDFWSQLFSEEIQKSTQQLADPTALDARYLDVLSIAKEDQLIDIANNELKSFLSQAKPYDVTDSDVICNDKFQQRYDFAIETFQKTCQQLREPHARDELFATLMDTLSFEYFSVYEAFPRMVLENIAHNLTHPAEFAKDYFLGMINTIKDLPYLDEKLVQFFEVYSSLTSYQRQELLAHIFADIITGTPFDIVLGGGVRHLFRTSLLTEAKLILNHNVGGSAYKVIQTIVQDLKNNPELSGVLAGIRRALDQKAPLPVGWPPIESFINKMENPIQAGKILNDLEIVYKFSEEVIKKAIKIVTTENKITHIFEPAKHNLGPLLAEFTNEKLARSIIEGLQGKVPYNGIFKNVKVTIEGFDVHVTGRMIDGIPNIGTFFIKR